MASLSSYLPQEGSAVWRRDRSPDPNADSQTVRHVVIRSTEVVSEPSPHVVSMQKRHTSPFIFCLLFCIQRFIESMF